MKPQAKQTWFSASRSAFLILAVALMSLVFAPTLYAAYSPYDPVELSNGYFVSLDEAAAKAYLWSLNGERSETYTFTSQAAYSSIATAWPDSAASIAFTNTSGALASSPFFTYQTEEQGRDIRYRVSDQTLFRQGPFRHPPIPWGDLQPTQALRLDFNAADQDDSFYHHSVANLDVSTADGFVSTYAGLFNGDACLTISDDYSLSPSNAFTISAWVNVTNNADTHETIFAQGSLHVGATSIWFGLENEELVCMLRRSNGSWETYGAGHGISASAWNYVAVVYDGQQLSFFLNGLQCGEQAVSGSVIESTLNFTVGQDVEGLSPFRGWMDDVHFYTVALSTADMLANYQQAEEQSLLVAYYQFQNADGSDTSGYGHHLSITGATFGNAGVDQSSPYVHYYDVLATTSDANLNFTSQVSGEGWIFVTGNGFGTDSAVISKWSTAATNRSFWFGFVDGVMTAKYQFDGDLSQTLISSRVEAKPGQWNHVGWVYHQGTTEFYLNGDLVCTTYDYGVISSSDVNLVVANDAAQLSPLQGYIDEVKLYQCVRSSVDIAADYNADFAALTLLAHYDFNAADPWADVSAYAHTLAVTSNPSVTTNSADGAALQRDLDDELSATHDASLEISRAFTMQAYIYTSYWDELAPIVARWSSEYSRSSFFFGLENGILYLEVMEKHGGRSRFNTAISPTVDAWHHVALTYDGEVIKAYLDGVLAYTASEDITVLPGDLPFTIGNDAEMLWTFRGMLDDVRLYNRARTADEIRADHNASAYTATLGTFSLQALNTETRYYPQIQFTNLKNGDAVGSAPQLQAEVYDVDNDIDTLNMYLTLDGDVSVTYSVTSNAYTPSSTTVNAGTLSFRTNQTGIAALSDGSHVLQLNIPDIDGNVGTASITVYSATSFQIRSVYNVPNPVRSGASTYFTYQLTQAASSLTIRIFNVNGRLIQRIDNAPVAEGFNRQLWDGRDQFGQQLATDVYFYVIEAVSASGENVRAKGKLMVLR